MSNYKTNPKFNRKAIQVEAAQQLVANKVKLIETEQVRIEDVHGRIIAQDIIAPHPYPFFRRSGMDGYAVRSADISTASSDQTVQLAIIDEIPCGYSSQKEIVEGTAARIMTGAEVPFGADAVVMLEATELCEVEGKPYVVFKRPTTQGANITPVGLEVSEGDLLVKKGTLITAGEISVLATFGIHQVPVFRKPQVGIFATGTELLGIDEELEPGKIRNSNSYMLQSLVREAGGEPHLLGAIVDELELAEQKLQEALSTYDVVITTGGVSVGDYDIMGDLVRQDEVEMLFNKVTMRPGSVTTAAFIQNKLLFALSGNPGACFVGFELFVRPALQLMQASAHPYLQRWTAFLGSDYSKVNNFTRFVRGKVEIKNGQVFAFPAKVDESSAMVTIKDSDCLIIIPPDKKGLQAGDAVEILKLGR
ncbi:molybdopterin molybdotransferase MoeA [Paenibacillus sp. An7]|uniref:molybdopterin molybdotransferase MoeA n=1 Tax=Paenibacillus sp. An7 TaxID=2689577 RepID=UPI00135C0E40|nr:gephyrin-like molybdotransferase Glp [Paenibacillus sp. An7]